MNNLFDFLKKRANQLTFDYLIIQITQISNKLMFYTFCPIKFRYNIKKLKKNKQTKISQLLKYIQKKTTIAIYRSILNKQNMQSKSSIKSKKQKLNEKKFSKGNAPVIVDIKSSSQDDLNIYQIQKIQKRSKYSGKSINANGAIKEDNRTSQYTPNNLNYDRIRSNQAEVKALADRIIKTSHDSKSDNQTVLVVQEYLTPSNFNQDRSLFSYKILGVQGIKYISQSHCGGRINSQIKQMQKKETLKLRKEQQLMERICEGSFLSDQDIQANKKQQEKQKQNEQKQRKKVPRYFEEQLSDDDGNRNTIKCFRCNKYGHIAKNCLEQQPPIRCTFCLQQHHQSECRSSPCFKCCQPGHISQDCTSKAIQCHRCNKRGHRAQNCGIYIPLQYHNKKQQDIKKRFKISDLKALKCLNSKNCKKPTGHFNCFTYNNDKKLIPYSKSYNLKGQKRKWGDGY